jgi:Flp pilus assembly protein TadG
MGRRLTSDAVRATSGFLRRFRRDRRGVSAVEFALVTPLILLMFFALNELGQGLMAQRRVSHVASSVGDLAAQATALHDSDITDIFSVANFMMEPMSNATLYIRLTSVVADTNKTPKAAWSKVSGSGMTAFSTGDAITLPTGLITNAGDSVVMAEATYTYTSPVGLVLPHGLTFNEKFFFRPRKSTTVTYTSP